MSKIILNNIANKLVFAFLKNKIITPIPIKYTKKLSEAQKLRKLCESKINKPIAGFKAAGTSIPVLKKLKEKEPFYASVYARNFLKSGKRVKINKSTLGIELEVCYLIKKSFFSSKGSITSKNVTKFLTLLFLYFFLAPIINFTLAPKSEHKSPRLLIPFFLCL